MSRIAFTVRRGEYADVLFDAADIALIQSLPSRRIKRGYAVYEKSVAGRKVTYSVARLLLGLAKGDPREAEHKNRNRLDNRRSNLAVVTRAENAQNLSPIKARNGVPTASRFRGVSRHRGQWRAVHQTRGVRRFLGYFEDERDAAAAIDAALRRVVEDQRAVRSE